MSWNNSPCSPLCTKLIYNNDKNEYTSDGVLFAVIFISWENNNENATKTEEILKLQGN